MAAGREIDLATGCEGQSIATTLEMCWLEHGVIANREVQLAIAESAGWRECEPLTAPVRRSW
jgi:hypothetical protein